MKIETNITYENLARAMLVLMGEGIDREQAFLALQSIGYTLLDTEILPEEDEIFEINEVNKLIEELKFDVLGEDFEENSFEEGNSVQKSTIEKLMDAVAEYGLESSWNDSDIIDTLVGCGITYEDFIKYGKEDFVKDYFEEEKIKESVYGYQCKCCGEIIHEDIEDPGWFGDYGEESLWGHLQMNHESLYEECQNWETPAMLNEYFIECDQDRLLKTLGEEQFKIATSVLNSKTYLDMNDKEIEIVALYEFEKFKPRIEELMARGKSKEQVEEMIYDLYSDYQLSDKATFSLIIHLESICKERISIKKPKLDEKIKETSCSVEPIKKTNLDIER